MPFGVLMIDSFKTNKRNVAKTSAIGTDINSAIKPV
jgi:hypothetical protein